MPQSALESVSDYLTDVRILLLDQTQPYRYDDPSLIVAFNLALLEGRRLRPDLFVFHHHDKVPYFAENDGTEVKIEPQFRLAFVYGTCAHALARDQESVEDTRANTFWDLFYYILTGQRQGAPKIAGTTPGGGGMASPSPRMPGAM